MKKSIRLFVIIFLFIGTTGCGKMDVFQKANDLIDRMEDRYDRTVAGNSEHHYLLQQKEYMADWLDDLAVIFADSDKRALEDVFAEFVKEEDTEMSEEIDHLMELIGGGTLTYTDEDLLANTARKVDKPRSCSMSFRFSVEAPNGLLWVGHIVLLAQNDAKPERVGVKSLEFIEKTAFETMPDGVGLYSLESKMPAGIRIIEDWETYDPTSRYNRNPFHDYKDQ